MLLNDPSFPSANEVITPLPLRESSLIVDIVACRDVAFDAKKTIGVDVWCGV